MDATKKYKSVFCDELFDKPERLIVVGASNVGKSCFINKLIKNMLINLRTSLFLELSSLNYNNVRILKKK